MLLAFLPKRIGDVLLQHPSLDVAVRADPKNANGIPTITAGGSGDSTADDQHCEES
jgi:hypothetical protein